MTNFGGFKVNLLQNRPCPVGDFFFVDNYGFFCLFWDAVVLLDIDEFS